MGRPRKKETFKEELEEEIEGEIESLEPQFDPTLPESKQRWLRQ